MPFESFSQNFEDVRLIRCFGRLEHGTYLDIGASEPCRSNNTYAFYRAGWSGVTVEPILERFREHRHLRPRDRAFNCAVGSETGEATFYRTQGRGGLSTVDRQRQEELVARDVPLVTRTVRVRRLAEIQKKALGKGGWFEFMSLDVEGAELDVLRSADFAHSRPKVIIVEAPKAAGDVDGLLAAEGYDFIVHDEINRWYAHRDFRKFGPRLARPINHFDGVSLVRAQTSCLKNLAHPDHDWALNLAAQLLRSSRVTEAGALTKVFGEKYDPDTFLGPVREDLCHQAHRDVLGRMANAEEVRTVLARGPTLRELYLDLCRSDEFKLRLGSANT